MRLSLGPRQLNGLVKAIALLVISSALVVGSSQAAFACSCASSNAQEQVDRADVVVVGTTDGPDAHGPNFLAYSGLLSTVVYKVRVSEVFKGDPVGQEVHITSSASGASCGWESMERHTKYLIFASHRDIDGDASEQLWGSLCTGTQPASSDVLSEITAVTGAAVPPDKSVPIPSDPDQLSIFASAVLITLLLGLVILIRGRRQAQS